MKAVVDGHNGQSNTPGACVRSRKTDHAESEEKIDNLIPLKDGLFTPFVF